MMSRIWIGRVTASITRPGRRVALLDGGGGGFVPAVRLEALGADDDGAEPLQRARRITAARERQRQSRLLAGALGLVRRGPGLLAELVQLPEVVVGPAEILGLLVPCADLGDGAGRVRRSGDLQDARRREVEILAGGGEDVADLLLDGDELFLSVSDGLAGLVRHGRRSSPAVRASIVTARRGGREKKRATRRR